MHRAALRSVKFVVDAQLLRLLPRLLPPDGTRRPCEPV